MIKLFKSYCLIRPLEERRETKSGILLSDTIPKEEPLKGEVVEVGSEVKDVKKGDKVLFKKYAPEEIQYNEETMLICKEEDILAVME